MADSVIDHTALQMVPIFQEEDIGMDWWLNQDGSMVERQARDLEVRGSSPGLGSDFSLENLIM